MGHKSYIFLSVYIFVKAKITKKRSSSLFSCRFYSDFIIFSAKLIGRRHDNDVENLSWAKNNFFPEGYNQFIPNPHMGKAFVLKIKTMLDYIYIK